MGNIFASMLFAQMERGSVFQFFKHYQYIFRPRENLTVPAQILVCGLRSQKKKVLNHGITVQRIVIELMPSRVPLVIRYMFSLRYLMK